MDSCGLPCTIIYCSYDYQRWASGAETMPSIGALTVHRIRDLGGQTSGHEDVLVFNHREARLECLEDLQ